jgi:putative ABC transport system ATP-binding protein
LLVADEPTSALDVEHREAFVELLFAQARSAGTTVLFVSHDLGLAARFDRCIKLAEINKAALV